ncbi:uncharacterized protein LOC107040138 [Diachasma alloeum]|uniref:uncharacterized protein LOC107040138 n=1 Tax=Diachasma alloeum TaxID=454923 RepID=UPI0007383515|nr:uncharacterized protein LOC107040138 [Diachasma alloeum]
MRPGKTKAGRNGSKEGRKTQKKLAVRPKALIIHLKEKEKYAEILRRVKKDSACEKASECVEKIRRTTTGDMLIILSKKTTVEGSQLPSAIVDLLGEKAEILSKEPLEELETKDLDLEREKEDVLEALRKVVGEEHKIGSEVVRSLRMAYGGTQTASVTLTAAAVKKILGEDDHGKIKISWVNCRIRRVQKPVKCFKCWHYGHLATRCPSAIDRSKVCVRCSENGHQAKECQNDPLCALCSENGSTKNCAHVAGSSRCPAYKEALQKLTSKRRP